MHYRRFMAFNIGGAIAWVVLILPAGWFLGQFEFVKKRFEIIVIGIIFISLLPMLFEAWKTRRATPKP